MPSINLSFYAFIEIRLYNLSSNNFAYVFVKVIQVMFSKY